ncbi:hypothetical protein [Streptomyces monashensis]|nr:hypothetical protein [Streptomyces monashensis]
MSSEDEMIACFLSGEQSSRRFGRNRRSRLTAGGLAERLLTHPDLSDAGANHVGERQDDLVCLEGHLRLTAYALAGFPADIECLVGTAPARGRWAR